MPTEPVTVATGSARWRVLTHDRFAVVPSSVRGIDQDKTIAHLYVGEEATRYHRFKSIEKLFPLLGK